jgi:cold shock protein
MREAGRCKFWNDDKGYGFIRTEAGDDLFVHITQCGDLPLEKGDRVTFERGPNPRTDKSEAKNVAVSEGGSSHG